MKNHRPTVLLLVLAAGIFVGCSNAVEQPVYPNRWVRVQTSLRSDEELARVVDLVQRAAASGVNGIALSAGLDSLDLKSEDYFQRLAELRQVCEAEQVDIVPSFWSAGYGGGILAHNKNLAAGIPVKEALFVVRNGEGKLVPDPTAEIQNGGFEELADGELAGFTIPGQLGGVLHHDTETFKQGRASLRFERFTEFPEENARIRQRVSVTPHRHYRVSGWIRAEGLDEDDPFGSANFRVEVFGGEDARRLQYENPRYDRDGEWHRFAVAFNSWGYDYVEIQPQVTDTRQGQLWLDELTIEEIALVNVLRRPGTPLVVQGETSGLTYVEGEDFAPVSDPVFNFRVAHDGPPIEILPGSRIRDGERLRVSFYHPALIYRNQTPICMSEPETYAIWQDQAVRVHEALGPSKYLLNMDEVRVGGSCEACKSRGMTNAEILGDCITRQHGILRGVNPDAEIAIWSDMLDPHHNANPSRKYYYLAESTFVDAWKYVPKDLVIVCWYYNIREQSLQHFSNLGFRTMAGAYYDADDLENPKGWLEALYKTPGACGIMYTTWLNKYDLMEEFGKLVSKR